MGCEEQHEESKCGRPLGLEFTRTGKLLVCDAVFGLYILDLDREVQENRIAETQIQERVQYSPLLTPNMEVEGKYNLVYNSLALAGDDETVYLTVSSTRFPLSDSLLEIMSDASGRVIRYNLRTKEVKVLVEDINF